MHARLKIRRRDGQRSPKLRNCGSILFSFSVYTSNVVSAYLPGASEYFRYLRDYQVPGVILVIRVARIVDEGGERPAKMLRIHRENYELDRAKLTS